MPPTSVTAEVMCTQRMSAVRISPIPVSISLLCNTGLMIHEILPVGILQCNCSIFGDESTREAIVIDPGDEIASILEVLARHSLKVKAIVITHAHIDHIGGAQKLKLATGAPGYMKAND